MVHMHYTQPLKIKFGTNHFFGLETLVPIQYRERVNKNRENKVHILKVLDFDDELLL